jgi:hypothetical protein
MRDGARFWGILILIVAAGAGAWYWYSKPEPAPPPAAVVTPVVDAAPPAPQDAAAPAIRHPIEHAAADDGALSAERADSFFEKAFGELVGGKAVRSFLNLDGFVRRFVVTVDNLATPIAAPQMWPIKPTAGHLAVDSPADATTIAASNADRYEPVVKLFVAVDTQRAVRLYRRAYPLFQQAFEELGRPGASYFNDRVVEVIDHLLATPTPAGPIAVQRLQVPGVTTPSNVYVFQDSALERATAGQKILMRMGPTNAAKVKAKLTEVRASIAGRRPR